MSRTTYERLKAFCESNNISMSQLVENRVNDFLGGEQVPTTPMPPRAERPSPAPTAPRPTPVPTSPKPTTGAAPSSESRPVTAAAPQPVPMTSAAARFAVEPPPPIIKQKPAAAAPEPTEKRPDQIFTF